jgi:hypothetical protein
MGCNGLRGSEEQRTTRTLSTIGRHRIFGSTPHAKRSATIVSMTSCTRRVYQSTRCVSASRMVTTSEKGSGFIIFLSHKLGREWWQESEGRMRDHCTPKRKGFLVTAKLNYQRGTHGRVTQSFCWRVCRQDLKSSSPRRLIRL